MILLLLLGLSSAILQQNAGINDWNILSVGEPRYLKIKNKICMISTNDTGQIIYSMKLNHKWQLIQQSQGFQILIQNHQSIQKFNLFTEKSQQILKSQVRTHNQICYFQKQDSYPYLEITLLLNWIKKVTNFKRGNFTDLIYNEQFIILVRKEQGQLCLEKFDFTKEHGQNCFQNIPTQNMISTKNYLILFNTFQTYKISLKNFQKEAINFYPIRGLYNSNKLVNDNLVFNLQTNNQQEESQFVYQDWKGTYKTISQNKIKSVYENNKTLPKIVKVWEQKEQIVLFTETMELIGIIFKKIWKRDEALSQTVDVRSFAFKVDADRNQYYQNILQHRVISIFNQLFLRLTLQAHLFIKNLQSFIQNVSFRMRLFIDNLDFNPIHQDQESEFTYEMRKILIFVTRNGFFYAYDSKKKIVLWTSKIQGQYVGLYTYQQMPLLFTYKNETLHFSQINQMNGNQILIHKIRCENFPQIKIINQTFLIITGQKILFYPEQVIIQMYFYKVLPDRVIGLFYNNRTNLLETIWEFRIPQGFQIIKVEGSYKGQQYKLGLWSQNKVFYKYVDHDTIAILISQESNDQKKLIVNIINSRSGMILHSGYQKEVSSRHKISMSFSQNLLSISYYSLINNVYEIWLLQVFDLEYQTSPINMIKKYWWNKQIKIMDKPVFIQEKFGFIKPIKFIKYLESKQGLLKKDLFLVTQSDQIYHIDRNLLNVRRNPSQLFQPQLTPYNYLIPFNFANQLSYNIKVTDYQQLVDIENIRFQTTKFESTIIVVAYGFDIFVLRVAVSGTFDMINYDFQYKILISLVIIFSVLFFILNRYTHKAKLYRHFKK